MKTRSTTTRWIYVAAAACGGAVLLFAGGAFASPRASGARTAPTCSAASIQVWLGDGVGGGFAGGVVYPLEFSNVGHRTCTLYGYPGVSATRGAKQVGPPASRGRGRHSVVTLAPGATAHASLTIHDAGAVCPMRQLMADGLKVYPPGQRASKPIDFSLAVCAHRAVLSVGAVRAGVGIPGYITR